MRTNKKPIILFSVALIILFFINITPTRSDGPDPDHTSVERVTPYDSKFNRVWEGMSDAERDAVHEKAIWMARVLLSEDKREEPWIMMASIIVNREQMQFRGQTTIWGVIHDPHQFSAVGGPHWSRYKHLTLASRNQHFTHAYEIARKILVMGVPKRYEGITHAYYPETMMAIYGYDRDYPSWDTPDEPMGNRDEIDGWVYGSP